MSLHCARGCTRARRHRTDCIEPDDCRGCQPRPSEHGQLCAACHQRLLMLLTDAPNVAAWLHAHLPHGTSRRPRTDAELRQGTKEPPAPADLAVIELVDTWRAVLAGWVDNLCADRNLTGPTNQLEPTKPPSMAERAKFLLVWLSIIETLPWLLDMFDELADLTRESHGHTPWSPEVRRVYGIPCPECHTCALVVYGGQSDVTCQHCRMVIPQARYGIWTRMLADEHRELVSA